MQHTMNRILAVLLIAVIFAVGGLTLATSWRELAYAAFVTYTYHLSETPVIANSLTARIKSLNNAININLFGKSAFEKINTEMQLALGKRMLAYGSQTMVWLKSGQLYDLQPEADPEKVAVDIDKMAVLNDMLVEMGVPMLFVYYHTGLYEDDLLPDGVVDYNNVTADMVVDGLRGAGVEVLDTRDIYRERGMRLDEALFYTDQHTNIPMSMAVYQDVVKWINGATDLNLDESKTRESAFDVEVLRACHMGDSLGARVGPDHVRLDDFAVYTPKFDTRIHERIALDKGFTERDGSFEDAVLNMDQLDLLDENGYANLYSVYGYHREEVYYTNADVSKGRALIVKDSFGTPVASLLSLVVGEELAVDLRKTRRSVAEYAMEYEPDFVVVLHCQEMMRGTTNYVFVD